MLPGPAQLTAWSASLAGPRGGLHFCKPCGDHFREAALGQPEGSTSGVNKGVQVRALLLANEMMSGEWTSLSLSVFVGEMG